jgi:hypothetical protein
MFVGTFLICACVFEPQQKDLPKQTFSFILLFGAKGGPQWELAGQALNANPVHNWLPLPWTHPVA